MVSDRCVDEKFWDSNKYDCLRCESKYKILAGFEFTENCGWSDDQRQIKSPYKPCKNGTYNNGSHVKCLKCSSCTTPFIACNTTSDTICCKQGEVVFDGKCTTQPLQTTVITTVSRTTTTTTAAAVTAASVATTTSIPQSPILPHVVTGIYVCLGILFTLTLVCLFLVIKRRTTKHLNKEFQKRNGAVLESLSKKGIKGYEQSMSYNIIKESDNLTGSAYLLAPEIQGAPLKTVLNNLDVLEELVLVLDPDISGAKNTRHLAAQCSFSFAWINYAYSMKDHKSPLVTVLEGVVTKNPDWTVGHLAELLTAIDRNDAVEILAKLPAGVEE
ncbi:IGF-like family receptor 1 [Pimephales promelas]|uniref:IGF-like family receptor 1 n=1 Tax=Pimephales promelas TaxID=90988 RepID=UPI001955E499|nr:IGF-like family receptor 1 [Pimephales promelas]KAG1951976.1 IGF-like family receptor [Pimephales promelas]